MTKTIKNGNLSVEEKETMKTTLTKTKEELQEFVKSDEVFSIKELRAFTGLSQRNFSAKYGIPRRTVEDWERGIGSETPWIMRLLNRVVKEDVRTDLRYNRI